MSVAALDIPVPEPTTVVRTIRYEVVWPGWRKKDLQALWAELWRAQDDLRRAANLTVSALAGVRLGTVARPTKPDGSPVSDQTLSYQALSGKWQPWGEPLYAPSEETRQVGSQVLLDLAGTIHTRISTDWKDIRRGEKSLPTWRRVVIGSTTQGITVDRETGAVSMGLWEGRGQRVTLRPRKLDPRGWADLRRALKYGSARLQWDRPPGRKGRWMLSISVELPTVDRVASPLVCAVRLGVHTTCTLAYAEIETKKLVRFTDSVDLPSSAWRAAQRVERERRERGQWNRVDHGQRQGRGRKRKLRALDQIGDVVQRVADTAVRQTSAAVVATAIRRGAGTIALPDLTRWAVACTLDATEDISPHGERARIRKGYFQRHWGALLLEIQHAAEREGLRVLQISPSGSSGECSECGAVGQISEGRFQCGCGCKLPVAANTAKVLARRAVVE